MHELCKMNTWMCKMNTELYCYRYTVSLTNSHMYTGALCLHTQHNRLDPFGCNVANDCPVGVPCTGGKCAVTGCTTDFNCPLGTYCIGGKCVYNGLR
jgi:hypothetical protein